MPRRKFVYSRSGVVETTSEEDRAKCEEIHADVESRKAPIEFGIGPRHRNSAIWPMASETFACSDAGRVLEEQELLLKHGVPTSHDDQFRPIWTSRAHKKAYQRALGYADPDAGYGDAEPVHWDGVKKRDRASRHLNEAREALIAKEYKLFGRQITE